MTKVKRPVHLHPRIPPPNQGLIATRSAPHTSNGDLLPSQIMPHLFVGNLDQTNQETVNRLNISYILSLGLMPLISSSTSCSSSSPAKTSTTTSVNSATKPATTTNSRYYYDNNNTNNLLPSHNSSKYFKFKIKPHDSRLTSTTPTSLPPTRKDLSTLVSNPTEVDNLPVEENKGIRTDNVFRTIHCKCINIADNNEQLLAKFFDEAHQFIDDARRRKSNVLVHCLAGISRSATIAIAYLMRCNSLRLQEAYNFVKRCRPQIDPNLSFMGQLMIYEKNLEENKNNSDFPRRNITSGTLNNINHHHQHHSYHRHKQNGELSSSM